MTTPAHGCRRWYYVVDRRKDMIIASGYKVWRREVEDVFYQHPAVREAAVIGVPDDYRGETVKAFVSLRPGVDAVEADLISFCKGRMPPTSTRARSNWSTSCQRR